MVEHAVEMASSSHFFPQLMCLSFYYQSLQPFPVHVIVAIVAVTTAFIGFEDVVDVLEATQTNAWPESFLD